VGWRAEPDAATTDAIRRVIEAVTTLDPTVGSASTLPTDATLTAPTGQPRPGDEVVR
jgi:hypothetical protein